MESDPKFLGPQALAKAMRFVGDPRDGDEGRAARGAERRARDLGVHALLLLQRALPEGRRPARRDREARRRVDQGGHRPRHGREAREVVRPLGEDDGLAARDRARAEDAGRRRGDQADEVRARPRATRARCRRRSRRTSRRTSSEARALHKLVARAGPQRLRGTCRASTRSRSSRTGTTATRRSSEIVRRRARRPYAGRTCAGARSAEEHETRRVLQGLPRVAVGEGARHLDAGARAEGRPRARSSSSRSRAAAPATSTRPSPTTTCT